MDYFISIGVYHSMNIRKTINKHITIHTLWLAMLLLTLSTYVVGKLGFSGVTVVFFLLATTVLKGTFIIRHFMELQDVSLLWRVMMYGWLWVICLTIGITYLVGLSF